MSKFKHLPGEMVDAALRLGALGAVVSGGIVAGQQAAAVRRGDCSSQDAVARTMDAAATGAIASAVGGVAAAAVGGHHLARFAAFLAGTAVASWAMSPGRPKSLSADPAPDALPSSPDAPANPGAATA